MSDGISDYCAEIEGDVFYRTGIVLRGLVTNQRLILNNRDWTEGMPDERDRIRRYVRNELDAGARRYPGH